MFVPPPFLSKKKNAKARELGALGGFIAKIFPLQDLLALELDKMLFC